MHCTFISVNITLQFLPASLLLIARFICSLTSEMLQAFSYLLRNNIQRVHSDSESKIPNFHTTITNWLAIFYLKQFYFPVVEDSFSLQAVSVWRESSNLEMPKK